MSDGRIERSTTQKNSNAFDLLNSSSKFSTSGNTNKVTTSSSSKTNTNNALTGSAKANSTKTDTTKSTTTAKTTDVSSTTTTPKKVSNTKTSWLSKINDTAKSEANTAFEDASANNQKDSGWFKNMFAGSVKQRWSDYVAALANQNETNAYADKSNLALGLALTHDKDSKASANELTHSRITENEKIYDYAYDVRNEGQENTQKAKNALGNSTLGNIVTDLSTVAVQVGGDALASALLGPEAAKASMAASVYGSSILTSKENGANLAQQTLNATANAGITYGLEALLGGLTKTYGSKLADKVIDKLVKKIPTTENGKMALTKFLIGLSESAEEMLEDIGQKMTERIYTNQGLIETLEDEDLRAEFLSNMLYDGLIGGLMGEIGAGVEIASDLNAKAKVEADARAQTSQNIDNVVDAMSMYDDAIINNIKNTQQGPSMENMDLNPDTNPSVQGPIQERQGPTTNFKPETNADVQGPVPNFNPETNPDAYGPYLNGEPDFRPETNPYIQGPTVNPTQGPTLPSTNSYNTLTEVIVANGKNYSKMASTIYSNPKLRTQFYQEFGKPNGISNTQIINDMAKTLSKRAPIIQKSGSLQTKYGEKIAPGLNDSNVEAQKLVANGITYSQLTKLLNNGEYEVINRIANLVGAKIDYDMSNGKIKDAIMERANDPNVKAMAQQMYNQNVDTQRGEGISRMDTLPTEQPTQPFGLRMSNHKDPNVKPQQELRNNPLNTKPKKDTSKPQKTNENPLKPTQKVQETKVENTEKVETEVETPTQKEIKATQKAEMEKEFPNPQTNKISNLETAERVAENMNVPKQDVRESGFTRSIGMDESMVQEIRDKVKKDPVYNEIAHNKDTLDNAINIIKDNGIDGALQILQENVNKSQTSNVRLPIEMIPLARILVNETKGTPLYTQAEKLIIDMSADFAYAGKFSQAASILSNTDPVTVKKSLGKWIDQINGEFQKRYPLKSWKASLTNEEINKINNTDFTDTKAYNEIQSEIAERLRKEMPATIWERLTLIRKVGMLFNPETVIKNFGANIPTTGISASDRGLEALFQGLRAKGMELGVNEKPQQNAETGMWQATVQIEGKNKSVTTGQYDTYEECEMVAKNIKAGRTKAAPTSETRKIANDYLKNDVQGIRDALGDETNKVDAHSIVQGRTTFKGNLPITYKNGKFGIGWDSSISTAVADFLNSSEAVTWFNDKIENVNNSTNVVTLKKAKFDPGVMQNVANATFALLSVGDSPFVNLAFTESLAQYCAANGINSMENISQEGVKVAFEDAMYYTYKNANIIAQGLSKIRTTPLGKVIVEGLQPFTTTPMNIMGMVFDHTLGGFGETFARGIKMGYDKIAGNQITNEQYNAIIKSGSKTLTGLIACGIGYALRNLGLITGAEDDDKDKAAMDKATGKQPFAILGKYTYDWAEPVGSYLTLGAAFSDATNDDVLNGQDIYDCVIAMGDAFLNLASMGTVKNVLSSSYTGSGFENLMENILKSYASSAAPSLGKAIAQTIDDKNRSSYGGKDATWYQNLFDTFEIGVPWRRQDYAENVNVLGTSSKNATLGQRFLDNFITPWTTNRGQDTRETKYIYDLYNNKNNTDDNKTMFTRKAPWSAKIDGKQYNLTGEEHSEWQKTYSTMYYGLIGKMLDNNGFKGLTYDQQLKLLDEYQTAAYDIALSQFASSRNIDYVPDGYSSVLKGKVNAKGEDYVALNNNNLTTYITAKTLLSMAVDNKDGATIDKIIKSMDKWDDNLTTVFNQRNDGYKMYIEAADAGVKANSVIEYKSQLDKIQRSNKSDSENGRFKFDALMDSNMSDTEKRKLADVVLNKTQVKVIEALEAGGDYNLADANNFWESIATVEVIDKDGNMSVESLTNISKATFRDALLYYYPNNSDARNKIWDFYYNQPEEHTASGYSTDYEVGPQYKNDKTKVTVDGKEMTRGVDYEMKKNTYGTWVVRFKEPVPKGCVIKIDDGVTPTINDRSLKYYTFDYFSKNTYDANSSKFHEVGETANPTGKKQNTSLNNLIQNYLIK